MSWFINKIKQIWSWLKKKFSPKNKNSIQEFNGVPSTSPSSSSSFAEPVDSALTGILEDYQRVLEQIQKKMNEGLCSLNKEKDKIAKVKNEYKKINEDVQKTKQLVVYGFWLIIIMVVGVFISYWIVANNKSDLFEKVDNQRILYDEKNSDIINDQNADISNIEIELNNLRNSIDNLKILNPYLK